MGEAVEKIVNSPASIVVISSVPPNASAAARYLVKRLRGRKCNKRILVGLWGAKPRHSHILELSRTDSRERFAVTFEAGLKIVQQWSLEVCSENRARPARMDRIQLPALAVASGQNG